MKNNLRTFQILMMPLFLLILILFSCKKKEILKYAAAVDGLVLRETGSPSGKKIKVIPYGLQVKVLEEPDKEVTLSGVTGKWSRIEHEGATGWVFGAYLDTENPKTSNYNEGIFGRWFQDEYGRGYFFEINGNGACHYSSPDGGKGSWRYTDARNIELDFAGPDRGHEGQRIDSPEKWTEYWEIIELKPAMLKIRVKTTRFANQAMNAQASTILYKETSPLHEAVKNGDIARLGFYLNKKVDINASVIKGHTALHTAAALGKIDVADFLIEKGADINAKDLEGRTPLIFALTGNTPSQSMAEFLISKGGDINAKFKKNEYKSKEETPLSIAVEKDYNDTVRLLILKGAQVDIELENYKSPLLKYIESGDYEMVKLLIEKGANLRNVLVLKKAIISPRYNQEIVKLLVSKGADVNEKAPICDILQSKNYSIEIIRLLLERDANVRIYCDYDGLIEFAERLNRKDAVELLKEKLHR